MLRCSRVRIKRTLEKKYYLQVPSLPISILVSRDRSHRPSPTIHPRPCSQGLPLQMELMTIQANVLLVCTSWRSPADVHRRPWECEPANRTQVHLLSALHQRSAKLQRPKQLHSIYAWATARRGPPQKMEILTFRFIYVRNECLSEWKHHENMQDPARDAKFLQ